MSEVSFPGPGQDGEQPPPGDAARDEAAGMPAGVPEDDWDGDAEMASYIADLEAGRARIPEEWEIEGPAATIGLGDAADVDLVELAAMLGPDGLGGQVFARDRSADVMRPGPVLAALTEQAAGELERLDGDQLLGVMSAAGRIASRAESLRLAAVAQFARLRAAEYQDAVARGVPRGCRGGEFPDAELAMELVASPRAAAGLLDLAEDTAARYPHTRAALHAGLIDGDRARIIWRHTRHLSDADAAQAEEILAGLAPGLRYDALARKATAIAIKLDPEAFKRGKEQERRDRQRVAAGPEDSGNAFLSGRELATEDVLASKAHIDALAAALRRGGLPGTLQHLRVLAFVDLTQGRDPLDRLTGPRPADPAGEGSHRHGPRSGEQPHGDDGAGDDGSGDGYQHGPAPGDEPFGDAHRDDSRSGHDDSPQAHGESPQGAGEDDNCAGADGDEPGEAEDDELGWSDDDDEDGDWDDGGGAGGGPGGPDGPGTRPGPTAPIPALINLTVPAGSIFGWSNAPGEIGGWGLTGPDETRRLLEAASQHPRTRLCVTILGPDGTAVAHGCARGSHPWIPPPIGGERNRDGPNAQQAAALGEFLRGLNITVTPIAKVTCDHADREGRYTPSRKLKHLIQARTARCTAPGCGAQAVHCDLDHTLAYPTGITCQCGLAPACRHHHRCKQAPGWQLEQPEPGVMRWTTPSGRSYTTRPTVYEQ